MTYFISGLKIKIGMKQTKYNDRLPPRGQLNIPLKETDELCTEKDSPAVNRLVKRATSLKCY